MRFVEPVWPHKLSKISFL